MKNFLNRIMVLSLLLAPTVLLSVRRKTGKFPVEITTNMTLEEKINGYLNNLSLKQQIDTKGALEAANDGVTDPILCHQALKLHNKLVAIGVGLDEAAQAAKHAFHNYATKEIQWEAIRLYIKLVNQGKALEDAMAVLEKALKGPYDYHRFNTQELLIALAAQGKMFEKAIEIAALEAESPNYNHRVHALRLYQNLLKHEQAFEEVQAGARKLWESTKKDVNLNSLFRIPMKKDILKLSLALVGKGYADINVLEDALQDESDEVRELGEALKDAIFSKLSSAFLEFEDQGGTELEYPTIFS